MEVPGSGFADGHLGSAIARHHLKELSGTERISLVFRRRVS